MCQTRFILCGFDDYFMWLFVLLRTFFCFFCVILTRLMKNHLFLIILFFKNHQGICHQIFIFIIGLNHIYLLFKIWFGIFIVINLSMYIFYGWFIFFKIYSIFLYFFILDNYLCYYHLKYLVYLFHYYYYYYYCYYYYYYCYWYFLFIMHLIDV
jgi:hypothetical protein